MKSRRYISLAAALLLVLCAIFSLSSCMSAISAIIDAVGAPDLNGSDGGSAEGEGTASSPDNGGNSGEGGGIDLGEWEDAYLPDREENAAIADGLTSRSRAVLSSVVIRADFEVSDSIDLGGYYYDTQTRPHTSCGSGVIHTLDRESGDAYIITNFHVVYAKGATTDNGISDDISVYLYGQESEDYAIPATFVGGSLNYDIAVLRVAKSNILRNSCALAATLGSSREVNIFDEVYAIGNPEAYGMSITEGIVSVESESLAMTGADGKTPLSLRVMRVSAAINTGNSGGGLYDTEGKLVGIVVAKRTGSDIDNIAYAIPIDLASALVDNILRNCDGVMKTSVYRCYLGIELTAAVKGLVIDPETEEIIKCEEVEVHKINDNCIVTEGIVTGDVIKAITIDGVRTEVSRIHHVIDSMLYAEVGSEVTLELLRGTEKLTVTVTVPESALTEIK